MKDEIWVKYHRTNSFPNSHRKNLCEKKEWGKGTNQGKLLGLVSGQVVRDSAFYTEEEWIWGTEIEFYFQGFSALAGFEPDSSGLCAGGGVWGGCCPVRWRMPNSLSGLCPLGAGSLSPPSGVTPRISPDTAPCPQGGVRWGQNSPGWEALGWSDTLCGHHGGRGVSLAGRGEGERETHTHTHYSRWDV